MSGDTIPMQLDPTIIDGPFDRIYDIHHLTEEIKTKRREQYHRFFLKHGQLITAAGKNLSFDLDSEIIGLERVADGNISIATTACDLCSEINACRPKGSLPFVCLVKARPRSTRPDGTSVCALCKHVRRNRSQSRCCRARGGKTPQRVSSASKGKRKVSNSNEGKKKQKANTSGNIFDDDDDESLFGEASSDVSDRDEQDGVYSTISHRRGAMEKDSSERLKNWNSPKYFDKYLSQSAQRQQHHRKNALDNPTSSTPSTSYSTRPFSTKIIASTSSASQSLIRGDVRRASASRLGSDQESMDVPLSQFVRKINGDETLNEHHGNSGRAMNGNMEGGSASVLSLLEIEMLCQRQLQFLKDLEKENKKPSFPVEELLSGQSRLSGHFAALNRSTSANGNKQNEGDEDIASIDSLKAKIRLLEDELKEHIRL